jgi:Ni/Fe-hydrogenase subunit HybB-like protein
MGAGCWAYQIFLWHRRGRHEQPRGLGHLPDQFRLLGGDCPFGTLISAILHLFRAGWRNPIARAAETMTVFAVCTAGLFPFIHLGRAWLVYYMLPFPNQRNLWPNFQSPLMFDVVAISTYLTVSSLFWYTGMLPDLAIVRDNASGFRKKYSRCSPWAGPAAFEQWRHYTRGYLFFAALATPLVISVHSVVSWDFALGVVPGWHTTIFAPYFVAGAIHSGLAMVLTLMIPLRKIFKLPADHHHERPGKRGQNHRLHRPDRGLCLRHGIFHRLVQPQPRGAVYLPWRATGDYAVGFWIMAICNTVVPLLFLFKKMRTSIAALFVISILVNIGMWYERFVIIITSVARDFIPHAWGFSPHPDRIRHHDRQLLPVFLSFLPLCQTHAFHLHDGSQRNAGIGRGS